MSLKPEVLDALVAAGCTAEQIAAAVKADMASDEQRREEKRAKDRERQRRHRASRDVTVTGRDSGDKKQAVSPRPPSEEKNSTPLTPPTGAFPPRGSRLPEDFELPDGWRELALQEGLPAIRVEPEFKKFKNHFVAKTGKDATKRDWKRTWHNWVLKALEYGPKRHENSRSSPHDKAFAGFAAVARDG